MKVKITYVKRGISQIRNIISEDEYSTIYKKNADRKHELETLINDKSISNNKKKDLKDELYHVKKALSTYSKPFFTELSPLGIAMINGILTLPETQGGEHVVKFEIL